MILALDKLIEMEDQRLSVDVGDFGDFAQGRAAKVMRGAQHSVIDDPAVP